MTSENARRFTWASIGALLAVIGSIVLMEVALAYGVHCPACDHEQLGSRYEFWSSYFLMKSLMRGTGVIMAFITLFWAHQRRYALIAIVLGFLAFSLEPL